MDEEVSTNETTDAAGGTSSFGAAFDGALQGTLYAHSQAGSSVSGTVALDDAQWAYVQGHMRVVATTSLFSCFLLAALLGVVLFRHLVGGWRR